MKNINVLPNPKGRISRTAYLIGLGKGFLITLLALVLIALTSNIGDLAIIVGMLSGLVIGILIAAFVLLTIARMHDYGWSAVVVVVLLLLSPTIFSIPVELLSPMTVVEQVKNSIGLIVIPMMQFFPGIKKENKFGPRPMSSNLKPLEWILCVAGGIFLALIAILSLFWNLFPFLNFS